MFGVINKKNSIFVNWLTINIKYYNYSMKIKKKYINLNLNNVKDMFKKI